MRDASGAYRLRPTASMIRVGCSGWQYKHWRGNFYPTELPVARWFAHYASVFDTVEINNSFYRLPEAATFASWAERAPRGFLFAVKASRYLTHMKKLKDPVEPVERFFSRARSLGRRLGPVLYQLPPGWSVDPGRLSHFLAILPPSIEHVVEFRDPSWYTPEVYEMLERHGVSLCLHDMPGSATGRVRVGPHVYVRFHGASGRYDGSYPDDRLADWAGWLQGSVGKRTHAYVYFNNDMGGHAPRNALVLRQYLEGADASTDASARRTFA